MKTTQKILASVASLVLSFMLIPAGALAQEPVSDSGSGTSASSASTAGSSDVVQQDTVESDEQDSTADSGIGQGQTALTPQGSGITVQSIDSAISYIYLDAKTIGLSETQSVVVGFADDSLVADSAKLTYEDLSSGEVYELDAAAKTDGAVLFQQAFDSAGSYRVIGIEYTSGDVTSSVDFTADENYDGTFTVEGEAGGLTVQSVSENSDPTAITVYAMDEEGNLVQTDSIEEAIAESGADVSVGEGSAAGALTVMSEDGGLTSQSSPVTVALDPGHDSKHQGASFGGLQEYILTFSIANYCKNYLEENYNVNVYMTHSTLDCPYPSAANNLDDISMRVAASKSAGAVVYVSFHINSGGAYGFEIYYPASGAYSSSGRNLASSVEAQLAALGLHDRGLIGDEGYRVTKACNANGLPGVLIEHAFIDTEASFLSSESNLQALGVADAKGIANALGLSAGGDLTYSGNVNYLVDGDGGRWASTCVDGEEAGSGESAIHRLSAALGSSLSGQGSLLFNAHVSEVGWQNSTDDTSGWFSDSDVAGVQNHNIEAVQFALSGDVASSYDITYRVYVEDQGWQDWVSNGEVAGTVGKGKTIEALQVQLVAKSGAGENSVIGAGHVQDIGWQTGSYLGPSTYIGTVGKGKRVEALSFHLANQTESGSIVYNAHVKNVGWQADTDDESTWFSDGEVAGTTNKGLRVEAIQVDLTGEMAEDFDIYYRVHVGKVGWLSWAKNGEKAGSISFGYPIEAVEMVLVPKGGAAPAASDAVSSMAFLHPGAVYKIHAANVGWMSSQRDGAQAVTTVEPRRIEAMTVSLGDFDESGSIVYNAHVQNVGWQGDPDDESTWFPEGETAGTTNKGLRLEAIQMDLTADLADDYDIYYRVKVNGLGWLSWAKNGEKAGSANFGYALEGLEVEIVPEGEAAPSASDAVSSNAFLEKTSTPVTYDVSYKIHAANVGWMSSQTDGTPAATTVAPWRIEAMTVSLGDFDESGSVVYNAHVQNIGWQGDPDDESTWFPEGETAGTTNKGLRLEAIQMDLTADLADDYDIYYRVKVNGLGWLSWAKNGEKAGSINIGYPLEALQVEIVPEGEAAPSADDAVLNDAFIESITRTPIMGEPETSVEQMVACYNAQGVTFPSYYSENYSTSGVNDITDFCAIVYEEACAEGVRPEVLYAQVMHETGWLQYGGDVDISQYNFGGLGATGNGEPGNSFPSVRIGLRAQVQHLKAYASTDDLNNPAVDTRFDLVARGCAPLVENLGGRWASDSSYGYRLVDLMEKLSEY